ncbi:M20 family metallopeptidase [Solibacillus sp. CAU 1738]|uniref:M20 family metallopeptidase n=1 Tax=Solibacillus sp. CAU 1738 TaxID=3140363 RepID=UPI0032603B93
MSKRFVFQIVTNIMKKYIEENQSNMFTLLKRLVNQDSGSDYKEGVDKVGKILAQEFEQLDFVVKEVPQQITGNHLVIQHKDAVAPSVLLVAHMDTVFGSNTVSTWPFSINGDLAHGPGVYDMKGSHVTLIYALKALINNGEADMLKNIVIIFNSDEEIGSPTSRNLIEKMAVGKNCCLCMEPARANGALVSGRRGGGGYVIKVYGKAAHAGAAPQDGANAIAEIAYKIIKLQELNDLAKGISVNVDVIHGGTAANVIADYVEVNVDIRTSKFEHGEMLEKKIAQICKEVHVPGTRTEMVGGIRRPPMEKNEGTVLLLERIYEVSKEIGFDLKDVSSGGGGDASFTAAMGIPTIDGLGPIGGNAHSEKEYLEISSVTERTLLLAKLIKSLSVKPLQLNEVYA